jgi:hypothetical protein
MHQKCELCGCTCFVAFFNEDELEVWHKCAGCGKLYRPIYIPLDIPHPSGRESKQGNVPT